MGKHISDTHTMRWEIYYVYVHLQSGSTLSVNSEARQYSDIS